MLDVPIACGNTATSETCVPHVSGSPVRLRRIRLACAAMPMAYAAFFLELWRGPGQNPG